VAGGLKKLTVKVNKRADKAGNGAGRPVPVLFPVLFFLLSLPALFPLGKKEEEAKEPRDAEWVLCVTAFDTSALSESRKTVGELVQRSLAASLDSINYRLRVSPEYTWYEGRAWARDQGAAAKTLAAKREERDRLLYRGDPGWRYRRDIKAIDKEIKKLEEAVQKAAAEKPPVEKEPVFHLAQGNREGNFPSPPEAGKEYRFCRDQKADAFLTGSLGEYYGRIFVSLKLYAVYTGGYIYEDMVLFSADDITPAAAELAGRLSAAVSGEGPAEIAVSTGLPDSLILIDHSFAAQGELERREYPPGKVTVEIFAPDHESARTEVELKSGELTGVEVNLRPQELSAVQVESGKEAGLSVYLGAQYMGEAPLTLMLPLNRLEHIYAKSPEEEAVELVFPVKPPAGGAPSNRLSQNQSGGIFGKRSSLEDGNRLVIYTKPIPLGENRVDKARRRYYWAWGGTWVTGIAAWMLYGSYQSQYDALKYSPTPTRPMYDSALQASYLAMGGIGLVSLAVLIEYIQMGRYIYTAGEDAPVVVK
jgi:hypothetical protein